MNDYGFVKVAAGVTKVSVANTTKNAQNIVSIIKEAYDKDVQILVCPELSLTAYTCQDLFFQQELLQKAIASLGNILEQTRNLDIISIIGLPLYNDNALYNCAVVIKNGEILGIVPKTYIPNYGEFYEKRWFRSGKDIKNKTLTILGQEVPFGVDLIFEDKNNSLISFGIEICEDLWVPIPPSSYLSMRGANIIFNLSASNELIGKYDYRLDLVKNQSARCYSGYVYAGAGVSESTTDLVFGGHAIIAECGTLLANSERFIDDNNLTIADIDVLRLHNERVKNTCYTENACNKDFRRIKLDIRKKETDKLDRYISKSPFVPENKNDLDKVCKETFQIQVMGLAKRLTHTNIKKVVIGVSGGLDSTLALFVCVKTFDYLKIDRKNILAITMPGFGTSSETRDNAYLLMDKLGVTNIEIDIKEACLKHFSDIGHDKDVYDVTYENVQARERTQILMDIANKHGALVIGTGDLSELALGWCTYNGDHMSMYAVNTSIPKTLVKSLITWIIENESDENSKKVLQHIIDIPISPELLPPDKDNKISQKTEDIIGKYDLHDFFLYYFMKYGARPSKINFLAKKAFGEENKEVIKNTLRIFVKRFFTQQFKRSCMPDGAKVGNINLSPRGDLRMPSDAEYELWLNDLDNIED